MTTDPRPAGAGGVTPLDPDVAREYAAGNTSFRSLEAASPQDQLYFSEIAESRRHYARSQAKWHASPEYKHVKKVRDLLIRAAAAVFALAIAGAVAIWALDLGLRYAAATAICGFLITSICLLLARYTVMSASREFVVDEEEPPRQPAKVTSKWLQDPDLQNLITLNRTQMQVYHELATNQATYASRNSRRAMLVGFLLLVTGGIVAIRADDETSKIVVGALAGLGSLLSGYISQTFLRAEDRAMEQLNFYFQQPLVTSYMLAAERLTLKLNDTKRDSVLAEVIKQVLGAARTAEAATDGRTTTRRRATRKSASSSPAAQDASAGGPG